jgi:RNA polymerase sigma factor (sigma-70 family)
MSKTEGASPRPRAEIVLELFERHHDALYAFARRSVDPSAAEDVVQETFTRMLQHPRLEELDLSISYLFRVVQNLLRRRYARSVRLREILAEQVTPRLPRQVDLDSGRGFRSGVEIVAELQELDGAFTMLAGDERDAIRMVVVEGRSYAEAARSLGVSVTTINNWKHRGLEKLRARYGRRETG